MANKSKYNGLFFPDGGNGSGHLWFSGSRSSAGLRLAGEFHHLTTNQSDIYGTLVNGVHASLHQCVPLSTSFHGGQTRSVELKIFPHYIVTGYKYLRPSDAIIAELSYSFSGGALLCAYGKTFDIIHPEADELKALIAADDRRIAEYFPDEELKPEPRRAPIGENPLIAFFNGTYEIAQASIPNATVTISNAVGCRSPTANGAGLANTIVHSIKFKAGVTLSEAMAALRNLHKFYELLLGYRQKYKTIELSLTDTDEVVRSPMRVHWSKGNSRTVAKKTAVHPADIPVLATLDRKMFEGMLSGWMESMPEMAPSRLRLLDGMMSNLYSYDRIIGAANVFDLLPSGRTPKQEDISEELSAKLVAARSSFRESPPTAVRDSVLSALGRAGKPTLRSKILSRAAVVNGAFGDRFKNIELACHQAVLCRNHYVHGSDAGFNYEDDFQSFAFITDTLEFVFSASDLIDCGWDVTNYCKDGGTASHPFHRYMVGYEVNMLALTASLAAA